MLQSLPLSGQLAEASPDLLRELMSVFVHALMGSAADATIIIGYVADNIERQIVPVLFSDARPGPRQSRELGGLTCSF